MGAFCISSKTSTVQDHASITTSSAVPNLFFLKIQVQRRGGEDGLERRVRVHPLFFFFFFFFWQKRHTQMATCSHQSTGGECKHTPRKRVGEAKCEVYVGDLNITNKTQQEHM